MIPATNSEARKHLDEIANASTMTDLHITSHSAVTMHPGNDGTPRWVIQTATGAVRIIGSDEVLQDMWERMAQARDQLRHPKPYTPATSQGHWTGD